MRRRPRAVTSIQRQRALNSRRAQCRRRHRGEERETADTSDLGPWPIFRIHARAIAMTIATCLILLATIELAFFRSGFFVSHVAVSDPQWPAAKLAIPSRHPNARVLYVGDSTMMT